ncbi:MAG: hypothetical protein ABW056_04990 [Thermoanaerobaculia bacterium]
MRRWLRIFACLFLLTYGVVAAVGAFAVCDEPCGSSPASCTALCTDCACCPNGVSTPFEIARPAAALSPSVPAFQAVVSSHLSVPQAEILHVPKSLLA